MKLLLLLLLLLAKHRSCKRDCDKPNEPRSHDGVIISSQRLILVLRSRAEAPAET
jgi:hypothetical protein